MRRVGICILAGVVVMVFIFFVINSITRNSKNILVKNNIKQIIVTTPDSNGVPYIRLSDSKSINTFVSSFNSTKILLKKSNTFKYQFIVKFIFNDGTSQVLLLNLSYNSQRAIVCNENSKSVIYEISENYTQKLIAILKPL